MAIPSDDTRNQATSALTFKDLLLEAAIEAGMAFYGDNGDEPAGLPESEADIADLKRHVNNAIRMFSTHAPPRTGWRWMEVVLPLTVGPNVEVSATRTITGTNVPAENNTILTANTDVFYPTMETRTITGSSEGEMEITEYISPTQVKVRGKHVITTPETFSISHNNGNYTLPLAFAGEYTGTLTLTANTNQAVPIQWTSEARIRQLRENITIDEGDPQYAAIRLLGGNGRDPIRRRYELMLYPIPDEVVTVEFSHKIQFDELVDLDDMPPTPIIHDETLRAAVRAVIERDVNDGRSMDRAEYYSSCLTQSHAADARSAPRRLGYFKNDGAGHINARSFRRFIDRPDVTFTP